MAAIVIAAVIRKASRRVESRLSDVTGLHCITALTQVFAYLIATILFAHLVPELRALGTALLAGVCVASVVVGLAAQNTLGNLVAGLSLVLYRPIRVGDDVQINSPKGLITARVELVSLGSTILRDAENSEVIVPNSMMVSSIGERGQSTFCPENGVRVHFVLPPGVASLHSDNVHRRRRNRPRNYFQAEWDTARYPPDRHVVGSPFAYPIVWIRDRLTVQSWQCDQ